MSLNFQVLNLLPKIHRTVTRLCLESNILRRVEAVGGGTISFQKHVTGAVQRLSHRIL